MYEQVLNLIFVDRIKIRERPLSSYKILPGDVLNLAVIANSDPFFPLNYIWMFTNLQGNQKEIESNAFWKISWPNNNILTIDVRQVSDPGVVFSLTGDYSVKIYHNYAQKIINITVETDIITTGPFSCFINFSFTVLFNANFLNSRIKYSEHVSLAIVFHKTVIYNIKDNLANIAYSNFDYHAYVKYFGDPKPESYNGLCLSSKVSSRGLDMLHIYQGESKYCGCEKHDF